MLLSAVWKRIFNGLTSIPDSSCNNANFGENLSESSPSAEAVDTLDESFKEEDF